jgi:hypothetical protein
MSSSVAASTDGSDRPARGRPLTLPGEDLLRVGIPPGTPEDARTTIQRLIELTSILATRAAQLQQALDSRVVIEQAKGIIAERYGLGMDDAFKLLRRGARSNRMRIHELAARVVHSPTTPPQIRL